MHCSGSSEEEPTFGKLQALGLMMGDDGFSASSCATVKQVGKWPFFTNAESLMKHNLAATNVEQGLPCADLRFISGFGNLARK